jgi:hypothetical protein
MASSAIIMGLGVASAAFFVSRDRQSDNAAGGLFTDRWFLGACWIYCFTALSWTGEQTGTSILQRVRSLMEGLHAIGG